jgi:hypothetical protein
MPANPRQYWRRRGPPAGPHMVHTWSTLGKLPRKKSLTASKNLLQSLHRNNEPESTMYRDIPEILLIATIITYTIITLSQLI